MCYVIEPHVFLRETLQGLHSILELAHHIPGTDCQELSKECGSQPHGLSGWLAGWLVDERAWALCEGRRGSGERKPPCSLQLTSLLTEVDSPAPPSILIRNQSP